MIWVILATVMTTAAFVQGCLGFGYALVALSVVPYFLPMKDANIVVSFSLVIPLALMFWQARDQVSWSSLRDCYIGAIVGLPLGIAAFAWVHPDWLIIGTAIVILFVSMDGLLRKQRPEATASPSSFWGLVAGVGSGFLGGSIAVAGPPIVAYAARQAWSPLQTRAFLFAFFLVIAALRPPILVIYGLVDMPVFMLSLAAMPCCLLGMKLGGLTSHHIDAQQFRRIIYFALVISSFAMIARVLGAP
ncbi:Sulfite exporter TauE/SafE [Planctomycetes bacterium Pan216]|uniref:Probable membrane transporter protein n=1 Tax=Kolteria novifilia TaxID=2527975 RepID=A0A518B136_9BACT|nr:Sulfite exporter TauE/SafE [Planctomycetes bacterium Pan216]